MNLTVRREDILKALESEGLETGSFIDQFRNPDGTTFCTGCAVGSTLLLLGVSPTNIRKYADTLRDQRNRIDYRLKLSYFATEHDAETFILHGLWLAALSAYFEGVAEGDRELTKEFVRTSLPESFDIEI